MFLSNWQLLAACISLHQQWRTSQCVDNGVVIWACLFVHIMRIRLIFLQIIGALNLNTCNYCGDKLAGKINQSLFSCESSNII
jgi:hypothetical protein